MLGSLAIIVAYNIYLNLANCHHSHITNRLVGLKIVGAAAHADISTYSNKNYYTKRKRKEEFKIFKVNH